MSKQHSLRVTARASKRKGSPTLCARRALEEGQGERQGGPKDRAYLIHANDELGHPNGGLRIYAYRQPVQPGAPQSPRDHGPCIVVHGVSRGDNVHARRARQYGDDTTQAPELTATQTVEQRPGVGGVLPLRRDSLNPRLADGKDCVRAHHKPKP